MNSAYSLQRKGQPLPQGSAFSHPVSFRGHREKSDHITISSISNTPRHYRQCFRQFDCKTDCFENGESKPSGATAVTVVARFETRKQGSSYARGHAQRQGILVLVGRCGVETVSPATIRKAVCGTQTKQGGCLYEQPVSQEIRNENTYMENTIRDLFQAMHTLFVAIRLGFIVGRQWRFIQ